MKMNVPSFFVACVLLASACFLVLGDVSYKQGSYANIHPRLMMNSSKESLENPMHWMTENIFVVYSRTSTNGSSITLRNDSVVYTAYTDFIPLQNLTSSSDGKYIDYEYRGKIILYGEEYVVKDVDSNNKKVYAYRGTAIDDVTSEGFLRNFSGYQFKAGDLTMHCDGEMCWVAGALIDVGRPDAQITQLNVTKGRNGVIDDLEVSIYDVDKDADSGIVTASVVVYNTSDSMVLEDGAKLVMNGQAKNNWLVSYTKEKKPFSTNMDIAEYGGISTNQEILSNITITYKGAITLSPGRYLPMPRGYKIVWDGTSLSPQAMATCSISGDYPPCNSASLSEVIQFINLWAFSNAELSDVIKLINLWRIS